MMFTLGIIALGGCATATLVTSSGDLGGVQEGPRWGVVKYLNNGADAVIKERKADARRIMREFCAPDNYKVVSLGENSTWATYKGSGGSFNYLHAKFECVSN